MQKPSLHYFTIGQLSSLYQKGTISPSDITRLELERIHSQDGELNAFATLMEQSAMESAEILGNELSRGKIRGPLHGVPIALKDLIYTMGVQTMGGTKVMENHIPSFDATLVTRLRDAGAIVLGKLNLTEGAMRGYNASRQVPKNPWNPQRWSGASSSGSGVAVSSGLCFGALGSDTGGSIRFPSASCGIVGLKPTYGAISRYGVIPLAESLDHVGPMTRSVLDAVYMFNAMIGRDSKDGTTFHRPAIDVSAVGNNQLKGLNIGYSESYAEQGVDPTIISMIRKSILKIESLGANIESMNFPEIDTYLPAWRVICSAEAFRAHAEYFPSQREDYGPWFAEWLGMGEAVTSGDYIEANNVRIHCNTLFSSIFEQIDAMICPTTTTFPEPVDDQINYGPMDPSALQPADKAPHQRFTVPFDYNGYPTICLPCGFNEEGMPGSLQIVGKPGSEETICRIAHAYESSSDWKDINPIP